MKLSLVLKYLIHIWLILAATIAYGLLLAYVTAAIKSTELFILGLLVPVSVVVAVTMAQLESGSCKKGSE